MAHWHLAPPYAVPPAHEAPGLDPRRWLWRDLGVGAAVTIAGFVLLAAAIALTDDGGGVSATVAGAMLLFEATLVVTVLLLANHRGITLGELGFVAPRRWWPLVLAWVGAYGILVGYQAVVLVLEALGVPVGGLVQGNAISRGHALIASPSRTRGSIHV